MTTQKQSVDLIPANNGLPLSVDQVREALDLGRTTVYELIDKGVLKPHYLRGLNKPFFYPADILKEISEKKIKV